MCIWFELWRWFLFRAKQWRKASAKRWKSIDTTAMEIKFIQQWKSCYSTSIIWNRKRFELSGVWDWARFPSGFPWHWGAEQCWLHSKVLWGFVWEWIVSFGRWSSNKSDLPTKRRAWQYTYWSSCHAIAMPNLRSICSISFWQKMGVNYVHDESMTLPILILSIRSVWHQAGIWPSQSEEGSARSQSCLVQLLFW